MQIVHQNWWFGFIDEETFGLRQLEMLERIGRVCYKSEENIKPGTAEKFVSKIIENGHESVLEHAGVTVNIISDRGVTHELVRHRLASYSQESTRYCNYGNKGMTVIEPVQFYEEGHETMRLPNRYVARVIWMNAMKDAENHYMAMLADGCPPELARSVLPNSLKTEIVMTANFREWRHVFKLRCSRKAHPQMRSLMRDMHKRFKKVIPVIFDDIKY